MKILVGYRGVNVGKDLLKEAVRQAKAFGGEVHVMTSLFGGEKTEKEKIEEAEENLENARTFMADKGVKCETHLLIRGRSPGEDIVEFAREISADEVDHRRQEPVEGRQADFRLDRPVCHPQGRLPGHLHPLTVSARKLTAPGCPEHPPGSLAASVMRRGLPFP